MENEQIEGIILKSLPLKDFDRLLTLFTPQRGLLKLVFKGRSAKPLLSSLSPLIKIAAIFERPRQAHSDLMPCREMHIVDAFSHLRNDYDSLMAACEMAACLLHLSFPEKSSDMLYALFHFYLDRLPACPRNVLGSFYLKTLWHEGLMQAQHTCANCRSYLKQSCFLTGSEPFCQSCASPMSEMEIPYEQWCALMQLMQCRSFHELSLIPVSDELLETSKKIFYNATQQ